MAYDNVPGLIVAVVLLSMLAIVCVGLRFYSRRLTNVRFWIDDWLLVPALLLDLATASIMLFGLSSSIRGLGKPLVNSMHPVVSPNDNRGPWAQKILYWCQTIQPETVGLIKLSVAFFYYRVFSPNGHTRDWTTWLLRGWIVVLIVWTAAFSLAIPLQCGSHPDALWDPNSREPWLKYCSHEFKINWLFYTTDLATDVITVLLPFPLLYPLRMPLRRKLGVLLLFMAALLSVGGSIGTLIIWWNIGHHWANEDEITLYTSLLTWHLVETHVALLAGALTTSRPIFQMIQNSPGYQRLVTALSVTKSSATKTDDDVESRAESRARLRAPAYESSGTAGTKDRPSTSYSGSPGPYNEKAAVAAIMGTEATDEKSHAMS